MGDPRRLPPTIWDATPTIVISALFTFVAVINWDYQLKFFQPVNDHGQLNYYLGPVMLLIGFALGFLSSVVFYFMRRSRFPAEHDYRRDWSRTIFLGFLSLVLFSMSLMVILFTPAFFTMMEQMSRIAAERAN